MTRRDVVLLDVKDLLWGYDESPSFLFQKFNFQLFKGDFHILTGKSGVGKSTLVKLLTRRLMPPIKSLYHKNEDISKFSDEEVQLYRRKIGVVLQDYKLIDHLSVEKNIMYPLQLLQTDSHIIEKNLYTVLDMLQLHALQHEPVKNLSGGEKQKVAIARAIIHVPEFLIADEPTGNLDSEQSRMIADILIDLNKGGHTILFITHDQTLIDYINKKHHVYITDIH